ncbi:MAG: FAD:protein FMN transferase [Nitrospirota bacterium]
MSIDRRDLLQLVGLSLVSLTIGRPSRLLAAEQSGASNLGLFKQTRTMMGGIPVSLTVVAERETDADRALNAAFAEMERLEQLLSIYNPSSEMSRLNQAAGKRPVTVSPATIDVLEDGLAMTQLTNGGFHMALGPAISAWDVLGKRHVPDKQELSALRPLVHGGRVQIDKSASAAFLTHTGMKLDPGGIGKGALTERAKQVLTAHGMSGGLIAAAGDIIVFGARPDGTPWRIGVRHPRRQDGFLATLDLTDTAISTSGDYERMFFENGIRYHHILDPDTLSPARKTRSVTVISGTGARADALATGAFVLGPARGLEVLHAQNLQGIFIDDTGGLHVSPALKEKVSFTL